MLSLQTVQFSSVRCSVLQQREGVCVCVGGETLFSRCSLLQVISTTTCHPPSLKETTDEAETPGPISSINTADNISSPAVFLSAAPQIPAHFSRWPAGVTPGPRKQHPSVPQSERTPRSQRGQTGLHEAPVWERRFPHFGFETASFLSLFHL